MLLVKKCQFFGYLDLVKMYYQLYSQFKGSYLRTSGYMTRKYTQCTIENVLIAALQKVVSTKNSVK